MATAPVEIPVLGTVFNKPGIELLPHRDPFLFVDTLLSADETGMIFAWDCGEWILFGTNALPFAVLPVVSTNAHKVLRWDLHLRGKRPKRLVLAENDVPLSPDFETDPEPWFYDRTWNMFRLTARGIDDPAESFAVDLNEKGALILLR